MFGYLADGAFAFWAVMAIGWVLVKIFEVEPKYEYKALPFQRVDFDPNIPTGILDHLTVLECYRDEFLKTTIKLRNDVTGQVVTICEDEENKARATAFDVVNRWRDSDYQQLVEA